MPGGLKRLDDRVLGSKGRKQDGHDHADDHRDHDDDAHRDTDGRRDRRERTETVEVRREPAERRGNGDGLASFLAVVWRISRLVLLALAAVVLLAAALILLPANEDNVIVRNVLSLGETVAGPFKDIFTVDDPDRMRVYNYGVAGVVYIVLASVVGKLPTGSTKP